METDCVRHPCEETTEGIGGTHRGDVIVLEYDSSIVLWIVVNLVLMVFIISGNLLTICAVRICRRLRAAISNLFILSLAVSDIIVGLTLPYHLAFYTGSSLGESHLFCLLRFYIIIFACFISVWSLISIAVDRYIAILYPLHYRRFMTRRVAMIIIALGWIVGTFVACIPVFWNHWQTALECEFDQVLPTWYMAGIVTPGFILIWICMLLVYVRIWQEASKQCKQMRKATCCKMKDAPSDWKSVQVVLLIMGGFTICWIPYFIVACGQIFVTYDTSPTLYKAALSLAMANSGLNPIIYAWKNSNFRRSFSLLLRCKSPNCVNNSEYSVREQGPRNVSPIQAQEVPAIASAPLAIIDAIPNGSLPQTQQPVNCSSSPRNDEVSTTMVTAETNSQVINELSAVRLISRLETNRNRLPLFAMMANESCMPSVILCSPCEICKLVLERKSKLNEHLRGTLVPWKCGDYNHHIINTMKCRW